MYPHPRPICMSCHYNCSTTSSTGATLISLAPLPLPIPTSGILLPFLTVALHVNWKHFSSISKLLWVLGSISWLPNHLWYLLALNCEPVMGENDSGRTPSSAPPCSCIWLSGYQLELWVVLHVSTGGMVLLKCLGTIIFLHNALWYPGVRDYVWKEDKDRVCSCWAKMKRLWVSNKGWQTKWQVVLPTSILGSDGEWTCCAGCCPPSREKQWQIGSPKPP